MDVEQFKEDLAATCREFDVCSLSVFGSTARGEEGPESDVDLLVRFRKPIGLSRLIKLEDRFAEILGRRVDLGTPSGLHPLIQNKVLQEAKLIYED